MKKNQQISAMVTAIANLEDIMPEQVLQAVFVERHPALLTLIIAQTDYAAMGMTEEILATDQSIELDLSKLSFNKHLFNKN